MCTALNFAEEEEVADIVDYRRSSNRLIKLILWLEGNGNWMLKSASASVNEKKICRMTLKKRNNN